MLSQYETHIAYRSHVAWAMSDLDGLLALVHDDIEYLCNVDGITVPYASSAVGKDDVRWRLQHLLDTFLVVNFSIEEFTVLADQTRSVVRGSYHHKKTGERLDVKIRFRFWTSNGLIVRIEEQHDAAYVLAFELFVRYLGETEP